MHDFVHASVGAIMIDGSGIIWDFSVKTAMAYLKKIDRLPRLILHWLPRGLVLCGLVGLLGTAHVAATWGRDFTDWDRIGLERMWQFQLDAGRSQSDAAKFMFFVSRRETTKAFEVVYQGGSQLFAPQHLDPYGVPFGEAEAARLADVEVRVLATRGIQAKVEIRESPLVTIYAQTARGDLLAINAETGELRWRFPTGRPDYPSLAPAANDEYVAVVNGSTLYVVQLVDGKLAFERQLAGAPGAGPAITDTHVYVPQLSGPMQAFRLLEEERRRPPINLASFGGTHIQPTVSHDSVSWPTDRGLLFVVDAEKVTTRFRLEARSSIVAHSCFLPPNRWLAASVDGYVFCFTEDKGRMLWQYSSGEPLDSAPLAIENQVFIVSERNAIFAIDADTGRQQWKTASIRQAVSASEQRLYCVGSDGEMVVLDRSTGGKLNQLPVATGGEFITNGVSDRIYLATDSGRLVCLREQAARWPTIYVPLTKADGEAIATTQPEKQQPATNEPPSATVEDDPFATGLDEAVPEAEMPAETDDPFGGQGADDLFGDDSAAEDDPFGSGGDPF